MIMCPPYCNFRFSYDQLDSVVTYSFDDICTIMCFMKLFTTFSLLKRVYYMLYPEFSSMKKIVFLPESSSDTRFALISCMRKFPYLVLAVLLCSAALIFSSMIQIAERPLNQRFAYYGNSLWFVLVSMTTSIIIIIL